MAEGLRTINYKTGLKYQLAETYQIQTEIRNIEISTRYITLRKGGLLTIYSGFCWDGPSGPTVDTKSFMRGSLVHDALYQLIRQERLPLVYKEYTDQLLHTICREDGMCRLRAWYVHRGVSKMAGFAVDPANKKPTITAP